VTEKFVGFLKAGNSTSGIVKVAKRALT